MKRQQDELSETDEITVREIALEAEVDPRSVRKMLSGKRVRGVAGDRIRRALKRRGLPIDSARS